MALEKSRSSSQAGFTLVEVLVAVGLLVVALVTLAELFAISTRTNQGARYTTSTSVLAEQKMEQLRGLAWGFDMLGLPLTDLTSNVAAFEATGECASAAAGAGVGLSPSPAGALATSTDGYVDYVDINGCGLGGGATAPAGTVYIRRWSIEPLPTNPNNTVVFQVLVTRRTDRGALASANPVMRLPEEARLISVKTRKTT
jgi:prepilin-type N-terminal cleavage/methylation domain-containing protein